MPVSDRPSVRCTKCGIVFDLQMIRRRDTKACPCCFEPIQELIELDRCDWSSGDYFPAKEME